MDKGKQIAAPLTASKRQTITNHEIQPEIAVGLLIIVRHVVQQNLKGRGHL